MNPRRGAAGLVAGALLWGGCAGTGGTPDEPPPRPLRVTVADGDLVPEIATGVAVGDGRVVTVAHALAGRRAVEVAGRRARVLRADRGLDLALLAVPGLRARTPRLGGDARRVGIAVVRGHASRTVDGVVRRRVIVRWREHPGDPPRTRPGLEVAARIDPGDSGAPVLDRSGRLLGVLYGRSSEREGTAWAVDASALRALLAR